MPEPSAGRRPGQQGARSRAASPKYVPDTRDADPGTTGRARVDTSRVLPASPAAPGRVPAIALCAFSVLLVVVCAWLDVVNDAADRSRAMMSWGSTETPVGLVAVAAMAPVIWRYPRHPVPWVIAGTGILWSLDALASAWAAYGMA